MMWNRTKLEDVATEGEPLLQSSDKLITKTPNENTSSSYRLAKCNLLSICFISCAFVLLLFYQLSIYDSYVGIYVLPETEAPWITPSGYLVWSPQCKMMALDPFAADAMKFFKKVKFVPCATSKPLTSIEQNFELDEVRLVFHDDLKSKFSLNSKNHFMCYYQEILRDGVEDEADEKFKLSKPQYFNGSIILPPPIDSILVICTVKKIKNGSKSNEKTVYTNAHAVIRRKPERTKVFEAYETSHPNQRPLSVLMLGIDSVSMLNIRRAMPNTAKFVTDNEWFELQGYNKMADNTFPNLLALLSGVNAQTSQQCDSQVVGGLNKCPFLWKEFEQNGYATAYAEDEQYWSTFTHLKKGFQNKPTTHYFRYFALAAEKFLKCRKQHGLKFCVGFQTYADYVFQNALDFATAYKHDPFFGLFWANTFSHNDLSDPSEMDERVRYYLEQLEHQGILNESAVIFFSDHGIRFGPAREQLLTGWVEERLPFMFIWLPQWFKEQHPEIVTSLTINKNRLTSPFDIHMTLKHILELSGRVETLSQAEGCLQCQSVFRDVPWNRSCSDAGIDPYWCVCTEYKTANTSAPVVQKAAKLIVDWINKEVKEMVPLANITSNKRCAHLTLKQIRTAYVTESNEGFDYLITLKVKPSKAIFDAIVRSNRMEPNNLQMLREVSRVNEYKEQGNCVDDFTLRKYCFCEKTAN